MKMFDRVPTILVVEDEPDIADGLKARLVLDHFEVLIAHDGKDGVEKARKMKPDLIIMDVMLPLVDGFEACKILKKDKETAKIPILFLTALPQIKDAEKAFATGADDFLNKPYTNERLMQKVYKFLPKKS